MAKHEAPIPYTPRERDTKSVAQRLNLDYLRRPLAFHDVRRKLTWMAPLAAALCSIPFIAGLGSTEKVFSNGPISERHGMFADRCEACHVNAFSSVPRQACTRCHDGPPHPAKSFDTAKLRAEPACTQCHVEHRGGRLAEVAAGNCTNCHGDLNAHATGVRLKAVSVTSFRAGKHPDFPDPARADTRPLRLNHAIHMPAEPKSVRGIKLPMQCADCHMTSRTSPKGDLEPVTFDRHCQSCHKRELEFLLPGLPVEGPPAPHTKDVAAIRQFILATYEKLAAQNPSLLATPLDRDLSSEPNAQAWIRKAALRSQEFLFEKKCSYCHELAAVMPEPAVRRVNSIRGRFAEAKPEGEAWLIRGEFSHRAHRALKCESCHTAARASAKTSDVLIPGIKECAGCHGPGGSVAGQCYECHLYHNKELEQDRRGAAHAY